MDHTGVDNAVAVGGTFKSDGCGPRKYAVSVQMKDMCVACVWGCHFVFGVLLACLLYLGGGIMMRWRSHPEAKTWREQLPHPEYWLELRALCEDGLAFTRGGGAGVRAQRCLDDGKAATVGPREGGAGGSKTGNADSKDTLLSSRDKKKSKKGSSSKGKRTPPQEEEAEEMPPVQLPEREWAPTRTGYLAVGARETGVKIKF